MPPVFHAGGALEPDDITYVKRQADEKALRTAAENGEFLHVIAPRQVGKTSLLKRLESELKCKGWRCLYLDLSNLMGLTMASWYTELGKKLADEFTPGQITTLTNQVELRDYLLNQALPWLKEKPNMALLLDEVESVLKAGADYSSTFSDTFFMTLRGMYNDRNRYVGKLVVVLAGATNPRDLVKDQDISPFNVGQSISLDDFNPIETQELTRHLADLRQSVVVEDSVHQAIYHWTNGHPYLTQRICYELEAAVDGGSLTAITRKDIAQIVNQTFLNTDDPSQLDQNVQHVKKMIRKLSPRANEWWLQILAREKVLKDDLDDTIYEELYLTGAIKNLDGQIVMRNHIYEEFFTKKAHDTSSSVPLRQDYSHKLSVGKEMPQMGKNFLASGDRKRIVEIVGTVIVGRGENGIKILLSNCYVPNSLINGINYKQGLGEITGEIVVALETWGSLDLPGYHALGAFLLELIEEVGHDAKTELARIILRYGLVKCKAEIEELRILLED